MSAVAASSAQTYAQLKAALWHDSGSRVHAVVDGMAIDQLPQKLAEADVAGFDCLLRGALAPDVAAAAGYVVELREAAPFTDWLLAEALRGLGPWGVVVVTPKPLLGMREHARDLSTVTLPNGERRRWRWYDPQVLQAVMPALMPSQLDTVFDGVRAIVVPRPDAWTWYRMEHGVLATEQRPLLAAAA